MYFSGKGTPIAAVTLIVTVVIICLQPVFSGRQPNGQSHQECSTGVPSNILVTQTSQSFSNVNITWDAPTDGPCAARFYKVSYGLLYKDMCDSGEEGVTHWRNGYVQHPKMHIMTTDIEGELLANSLYRICVKIWNGTKWGKQVCVNFTTGYNAASAPVKDLSGSRDNNQLVFSWSAPACGTWHGPFFCYNYTLFRSDNRQIANSSCSQTREITRITFPLDSLRGCTFYTFKVQVVTGTIANPKRSKSSKSRNIWTRFTAPGVPRNINLSQSSGSGSEATVSWNLPIDSPCEAVWHEVSYELLRKDMCNISSIQNRSGYKQDPATSRTITVLANSLYQICVRGKTYANFVGKPACGYFLTRPGDPDPVQRITVSQNSSVIEFSWPEPQCGQLRGSLLCYKYELIREDESRNDSGCQQKRQKAYLIADLLACTSYEFKVQVVTGTIENNKTSGWVSAERQRTPTKAPGKPRNVIAEPSGSVATVTWDAPNDRPCDAVKYYFTSKLLYKDKCKRSSVGFVLREYVEQQPTRKTIMDLLPFSVYETCIRGWNNEVDGKRACVNFTTGMKEPSEPPRQVNNSVSSYNSLTFIWKKPRCGYRNGPISRYEYILNATGINAFIQGNVTGDKNGADVTFNKLIPATTYSFRVKAINEKLFGNYGSPIEATTHVAVLLPPRNIDVTTLNETTAVVEWISPPHSDFATTEYKIECWESNANQTRCIVVSCETDSCRPAGLMKETITGLRPATNYSVQVFAVYKYGNASSSPVVFKTQENEVEAASRASGKTAMIPIVAIIFVIIFVLLFVVASQLYSRKTNKQLFKWPELFAFSLPGILTSLRRTDTSTSGSAQTPNNHTTRYVNGDGMEMNVTCDVSQSDNHACHSEMESDLSPAIYENVTSQTRKHTAIPVGQLLAYVARKNVGGFGSFDADFKSLPSNDLHSQDIASQESNKEKNRFKNILPYDHSRVKLSVLNDDPSSDYINASFIDGYRKPKKYIAGQGPNTASMDDFWRMVWQYNSRKIVMLTNLREANKKKCEKYWPARSDTFGGIVVTMAKEDIHDHYTVRYFNLVCNNTGRDVIQYHYTTWPDMGVPEYSAHLMSFLKITRQNSGPAIVHCSAGVGRTGTFLALDAMLDQVEAEQAVDIHSFIANMRQKRPLMVQTKKQYRFIYEALVQELTCGDTSIEQNVFTETYHSLLSKKKGTTVMQQQFELLEALTVNLQDEEVAAARTKENAGKNRFKDKVPAGRTRPFLMTAVEGGTDYINASFLPGCVSRNQYIGTQTPLPNTVADFWRLVVDYKVNTIVMLHGNSRDKTYAQYWNKEESTQYGSFKVQVIKEEYNRPIMYRTMEVTNTDSKKASSRTVKQFQLASCPPKSEVPPMADVMQLYKALISDAGSTDWKEGNSPLFIHCRDGEGITGAFCAFMSVMDHLNTKQTIDVFHACKRLRTSRPGAVATLAQYQFIYEAVKSYLMSTSIYENMAKIV